ncbi:LINE-1 retrotransposable element ORF1 protein [Plecturocebus cupreus]
MTGPEADLSAETLHARREWGPTFNILKEKNFQSRISYPAKLSFISEGKIKSFANKQLRKGKILDTTIDRRHLDRQHPRQLFPQPAVVSGLVGASPQEL